ncbi:MAG: DUF7002 family protein [Roseicyclus sp.]
MTPAELLRRLGPRLWHVTAEVNGASIARHGLMTPHALARMAGVAPEALVLRADRRELTFRDGRAILNHQLPLRAGRGSAAAWLDGITIEEWSARLDRRVFFWVGKPDGAFRASVEADGHRIAVYSLCTRRLIDARVRDIWLSPINSGNARRRPSPRGSWL